MVFSAMLGSLAACGGGGGGTAEILSMTVPTERPDNPAGAFSTWYVTGFSPTAVAAIRQSPRFMAHDLRVDYGFSGNPELAGVVIDQNAFATARLEYALSTGLSGAGQIVSMLDTAIATDHAEFAGKRLVVSGTGSTDRAHGTAVASVLVGSAQSGEMLGAAPGADLHVGQINFGGATDFTDLAAYMDIAASLGAEISGNSWNLIGSDAAGTDYAAEYASGGKAVYLDALRRFAGRGVVIFGVQNDFASTSVNQLNGLPNAFPELERGWLAAMSAVPIMADDEIVGAARLSAPCNEAARYCVAANGTVRAANAADPNGYISVSGTSFVVPQVAGALALMAEAFPDLSPAQLRDRLLVTAENGFFAPDGVVEFAPGVTHGYSNEFGHGFIDLRAALLPIGAMAMPMADGAVQPLGRPVVVSGGPSGDAIGAALARRGVIARDALGGGFSVSAAGLTATAVPGVRNADRARALVQADLGALHAARIAGLGEIGADFGAPMTLMPSRAGLVGFSGMVVGAPARVGGGIDVAALLPVDEADAVGLQFSRTYTAGPATLRLGAVMTTTQGDMLGIYVPGAEDAMRTDAFAMQAEGALRLGQRLALRAGLEVGVADGPGAGVIAGFRDVRFSAYEVGLDRHGVFDASDVMRLAVRRPLAITGGRADMRLASSIDRQGRVGFEDVGVPLAPEAREVAVNLEYLRALGASRFVSLSVGHAWNAGHLRGERRAQADLLLQRRF